ncbi:Hypothetical predicted protein [Paramuricea clavata]|uniref:Uncharacterized protein n=1 Tax=Paramuricea clavata TaxID=317549 RepID=A0A6S7GZ86_PARCT|nr:Hypothetical predicted protein [Paramuricea clavata]
MHNRQEYGVMLTEDATVSAALQVVAIANNGALAGDQVVAPMAPPLRFGWRTKEIYVNNELINPTSTHEGAHKRCEAFAQGAEVLCMDHLDLLGHNKRYVPSSYDMKIVLHRLEKTKYLFGTDGHCQLAKMLIKDLKLTIPMMKPVQQLSKAINDIMIQKGEECKFYTTHRLVAKPLAIGAQYVQFSNIFNGARPTRLICYQKSQTRYNGSHEENTNRLIFPNINHFVVKINEANVVPTISNAKESYLNLVRVLNCRHSEMPFDFEHYEHLIFVGEFRNQLSIVYKSAAHKKYDF